MTVKSLLTFPIVDKQICTNCKIKLNKEQLSKNVQDITYDGYGLPIILVRCPVCKTLIEWETKCS